MPKKQRIYDYFSEFASEAQHIVIFENLVKSMTSCLSKLKVTPSFCFGFKISDDPTATSLYKLSRAAGSLWFCTLCCKFFCRLSGIHNLVIKFSFICKQDLSFIELRSLWDWNIFSSLKATTLFIYTALVKMGLHFLRNISLRRDREMYTQTLCHRVCNSVKSDEKQA